MSGRVIEFPPTPRQASGRRFSPADKGAISALGNSVPSLRVTIHRDREGNETAMIERAMGWRKGVRWFFVAAGRRFKLWEPDDLVRVKPRLFRTMDAVTEELLGRAFAGSDDGRQRGAL